MEQFFGIILGAGGGSIVGWIASALITGGEYKNRIKQLEVVAHEAPCRDINAIKVVVERIETNVEWLCKENGKK